MRASASRKGQKARSVIWRSAPDHQHSRPHESNHSNVLIPAPQDCSGQLLHLPYRVWGTENKFFAGDSIKLMTTTWCALTRKKVWSNKWTFPEIYFCKECLWKSQHFKLVRCTSVKLYNIAGLNLNSCIVLADLPVRVSKLEPWVKFVTF